MEPTDLTSNSSSPDRRLEEFLRPSPLPDDGFTQRVLLALPPRETAGEGLLQRWIVCLVGAAIGLGTAVACTARSDFSDTRFQLEQSWAEMSASLARINAAPSPGPLLFACLVAAASLYYAFSGNRTGRSL